LEHVTSETFTENKFHAEFWERKPELTPLVGVNFLLYVSLQTEFLLAKKTVYIYLF
jgi:hypothetical protein